jgi:hypothetical protein
MTALILTGVTMESFGAVPAKDNAPRVVIGFRAPITEGVVKAMGLQWAFTGDSLPREPLASMPLKLDLVDMVLRMPAVAGGLDSYYPERVMKFFVERTADSASLLFRVRFAAGEGHTEKLQELLALFFRHRAQAFDLTLETRQGNLFEEGTRVDMAPAAAADEQTVIKPEVAGPTLTPMTEAKQRGLAKGKSKNKLVVM